MTAERTPAPRNPAPQPLAPQPLAWFRRISFRLTLALAGLALVAYFAFPRVHQLALRTMGLPGIEHRLVRVDELPPSTGSLEELAGADLLANADVGFVARHLLADAEQQDPGRWIPTDERARAIDAALAVRGVAYVWVDADRTVVARSDRLVEKVPRNTQLDGALLEEWPPEPVAGSKASVGRLETPVWNDGELAGWLLLMPAPGTLPAAEDGPVLLPETRFEDTVAWRDRVINLASIAFIGLLVAGLSIALSRMVTKRVTRLSELASVPLADPGDLPGPFDESGADEIARLARSMNAMRARVLQAVEGLRTSDRERRRWIAQVSHDLRTPLTALMACLERADEDLSAGRNGEVRERLAVARLDAERLGELAEDLLDIARLEAEETRVREPVPPGELARQAAHALGSLALRNELELELDVEPGLPELVADGRRLMRGLENLLRNALHHARQRVVIEARRIDDAVRFAVKDDGPGLQGAGTEGIDWDALAERKSRPDSAGLGLVVVRKVAELHGGRVGAENLPEGGARVWFDVPVLRSVRSE